MPNDITVGRHGNTTSGNSVAMKSSLSARILAKFYGRTPRSQSILNLIVRLEGGQMTSSTLRHILSRHHSLEIGKYAYGSLLIPGACDRHTEVGPYASIGPNVRRIGAAHPLGSTSMHPYWYNARLGFASASDVARSSCSIGPDTWIGAGTIILPACRTIGLGAVVGAGSVVTTDIPAFAIYVGNPARLLRYRFDEKTRDLITNSRYWECEPVEAYEMIQAIDEVRANRETKFESHDA